MIDYLFVYSKGWYLKINTIKQLTEYHKKTDQKRVEGVLMLFMQKKNPEDLPLEDRIKMMKSRDYKYLQAAIIQAKKVEGRILDGFRCLNMEIGKAELQCIKEHGAVYINRVGGHTYALDYTQFCRRKELVFPNFKLSDIRVRKYPEGVHWYAYIDDMQVKNGDNVKWSTCDAAKRAAEEIVMGH